MYRTSTKGTSPAEHFCAPLIFDVSRDTRTLRITQYDAFYVRVYFRIS